MPNYAEYTRPTLQSFYPIRGREIIFRPMQLGVYVGTARIGSTGQTIFDWYKFWGDSCTDRLTFLRCGD